MKIPSPKIWITLNGIICACPQCQRQFAGKTQEVAEWQYVQHFSVMHDRVHFTAGA